VVILNKYFSAVQCFTDIPQYLGMVMNIRRTVPGFCNSQMVQKFCRVSSEKKQEIG